MESSYGIGVQNRFELFYNDDAHPLDFLKLKQSKKSLKNDETAEKENQGKTTKTKDSLSGKKPLKSDVGIKSFTENDSRSGNHEVGGRQLKSSTSHPDHDEHKLRNNERVKFSDREERNNRRNEPAERRENRDTHEGGVPQRFDGEARGGGRGGRGFSSGPYRGRGPRRGGRGGPGGFSGGDFRGKREFDRQSGMVTSGVKAFDKRDGAGPYNWGSDKDQIEEQMQGDLSTDGETGANSEKAQVEDGSSPAIDDAQREEEAAQREMTLDEWKALQKREKPIFKTRLAGEGENTAQWKKTYVLKKKEEEEKNATSDEEENAEEEEEAHHGRKKVLLPIDFQFADTPSRGRGRGRGRGGPGGRGRGMGGFNGGGGRGFSGSGGRGMGAVGGARGGRGGPGGPGGPPHARSQAASRQEAPKMDDERDFPSLG